MEQNRKSRSRPTWPTDQDPSTVEFDGYAVSTEFSGDAGSRRPMSDSECDWIVRSAGPLTPISCL